MVAVSIVWFRHDLRLSDQPALHAAARSSAVVPVYIFDDAGEGHGKLGSASRWWLHHSLAALTGSLAKLGSKLVLCRGNAASEMVRLAREVGAEAVYFNRRYDRFGIAAEQSMEAALTALGVEARGFDGNLLRAPEAIRNKQGKPFQVFTPYWQHCLQLAPPAAPLPAPQRLAPPSNWPKSATLAELELLPKIRWYDGLEQAFEPGEDSARQALRRFVDQGLATYQADRDLPSIVGTSRMSAPLAFGEISPREIYATVDTIRQKARGALQQSAATYLKELGWREFAHNLLVHFPQFPDAPLRREFAAFPWVNDDERFVAWSRGRTGYPIVDAGMRELWQTGFMHNRVRMIVASFLVKHLLSDWRLGSAWFWDTLVDADIANNAQGWQWSAGCGADAAPFFRVFNPVLQGQKFDTHGAYVRRWCPELASVPDKWLHKPWEAPAEILKKAGVRLGETYPKPIVDHAQARFAALKHFDTIKRALAE